MSTTSQRPRTSTGDVGEEDVPLGFQHSYSPPTPILAGDIASGALALLAIITMPNYKVVRVLIRFPSL